MQSQNANLLQKGTRDFYACWALVERIADSAKLARSARLRDLLLFVSRRSLKEGCDQIREQEIGTEVFGRPSGYDTNVDNIVRVNASELRKRIDAYFKTEGAHETLILEIPRGSYVPAFRYRLVESQVIAQPEPRFPPLPIEPPTAVPSVQTPVGRRNYWILTSSIISGVMVLALACGCVALWLQNRAMQRSLYPWRYEPELKAFWSTFLDSPLDTDIVLPDASLGQIQLLTNSRVSLQDYLSRSYISRLQAANQDSVKQALLSEFSTSSLVTPGSFRLAESIQALEPGNKRTHIYLSDEYRAAFVEADNLILIGVPFANPWMELYRDRLNFTVLNSDRTARISNRSPEPGEQAIYIPSMSEGYCTIAYLPNFGHKGKILIIQGTNPPAFEAAKFFILSDTQLSNFRNMLHLGTLPPFDVLLKASSIRGIPINATIVAYRTYPNLR